jgi:TonB family protein
LWIDRGAAANGGEMKRLIGPMTVILLVFGMVPGRTSEGQTDYDQILCVGMPSYPALARQTRTQGRVEVEIETDSDGRVVSQVARIGNKLLAQSALENIKTWRFGPWVSKRTIVYEFRIEATADLGEHYYRYGKVVFDLPSSVEVIVPPAIILPSESH